LKPINKIVDNIRLMDNHMEKTLMHEQMHTLDSQMLTYLMVNNKLIGKAKNKE